MSAIADALPDRVATIVAAAVDPREIAAHLEVAGVSRRVARDIYGSESVFALADELWNVTPFVAVTVPRTPPPVPGGPIDLVRGLVYAAPALLLFALQRASSWPMTPLLLALAVTWGWGLGQVTANLAYALRGRLDSKGELAVLSRLLVLTPPTTLLVVAVPTWWSRAGVTAAAAAVCLTTFMVASAVLVLEERLRLAVLCLAPALVVSVVELVHPSLPASVVVGSVAVTTAATVGSAWTLVQGPMPTGVLFTEELRRVAVHFVHGLVCGAALAAVVFASARAIERAEVRGVVSVPIVLSLGVMEWQLRTFRSGASSFLDLPRLEVFEQRTWALFRRCLVRYTATVFCLSAAVVVGSGSVVRPAELAVFGLSMLLGPIYLADVTLVSLGRVDLALRAWVHGLVVGLAAATVGHLVQLDPATAGAAAAAIGLLGCAASIGRSIRTPVVAAVNHH